MLNIMNAASIDPDKINIFFTYNKEPFSNDKWNKYSKQISKSFLERVLKYRRWQDRQNALTGRLLLKTAITRLPDRDMYRALNIRDSIDIDSYGKPYFKQSLQDITIISKQGRSLAKKDHENFSKIKTPPMINFNISHSGNYAVCALHSCKTGIDIEKIKPVNINDFHSVLTSKEKEFIEKSGSPLKDFYHIWTRKESVIKAHGTGLSTGLSSFCVMNPSVELHGDIWHLYPFSIDEGYVGHAAAQKENLDISKYRIFF
ncbi:MAG: 4'-phosphopantetheinyl transferase superfamily protein [Desulfamplus sp.]|nr:4'-phosphopantetheinyl transferase superfamily protein [Desulfamplus sp.]